ncbi:cyanase [Salinactinospora qingdaonensis]|uniref:Cyanate hydratase n=1 Tax=Salinactinospora qingdaonensis TaxID=702744 RepID=A0ABP7FPM4_9ACTN
MSFTRVDPIGRAEAAEAVLQAKRIKGLTWEQIAQELGRSKVWTAAALLGQHTISAEQASTVGRLLRLEDVVVQALQLPPVRGAGVVDTSEPVVYRLEEVVQVYGRAVADLIREEFGDGIMSAIDFEMDVERVEDPKGDRVVITLNGKYLPYREF